MSKNIHPPTAEAKPRKVKKRELQSEHGGDSNRLDTVSFKSGLTKRVKHKKRNKMARIMVGFTKLLL